MVRLCQSLAELINAGDVDGARVVTRILPDLSLHSAQGHESKHESG